MAVRLKLNYSDATPVLDPVAVAEPTYKDILLDIEVGYTRSRELLKEPEVQDILAITDYTAVARALKNLFLTLPGQKILNPLFGLDLRKYLFEPVSERIGYIIGEELYKSIPVFEPRVSVSDVIVTANLQQECYVINLTYTVPSLRDNDKNLNTIKVSLTKSGFNII